MFSPMAVRAENGNEQVKRRLYRSQGNGVRDQQDDSKPVQNSILERLLVTNLQVDELRLNGRSDISRRQIGDRATHITSLLVYIR